VRPRAEIWEGDERRDRSADRRMAGRLERQLAVGKAARDTWSARADSGDLGKDLEPHARSLVQYLLRRYQRQLEGLPARRQPCVEAAAAIYATHDPAPVRRHSCAVEADAGRDALQAIRAAARHAIRFPRRSVQSDQHRHLRRAEHERKRSRFRKDPGPKGVDLFPAEYSARIQAVVLSRHGRPTTIRASAIARSQTAIVFEEHRRMWRGTGRSDQASDRTERPCEG